MHANSREDIKEANAGDIVALVGLKNTITGQLYAIKKILYYLSQWNFQIL